MGAQGGPVVVGAVEHVVPAEGLGQVDPGDLLPAQGLGGLEGGAIVHQGGVVWQPLCPHIALIGDEGEVDRDVHVLPQPVDVTHPLLQVIRWGVLGKEGLAVGAEVDAVVLLLAQQSLRPGLQVDPAVPQGELVDDVILKRAHERAADQAVRGGGLPLGQIAVLLLGKRPVGQEEQGRAKSKEE